ncbi:hypothetical protein [Labrenzia sp. OB1]|uniref:hypothetical protein n=1 Tax=Labrenzia sp. OB1 TaxID=1561204 RepID=UPI000AF0D904|nr:hypothetical protein [Labrenzia sp. OB1]
MTVQVLAFEVPQSVNTPTSPNSNVVTTPSGDPNNTTTVTFEYQGRIPVWNTFVSQAQPTSVLGQDYTIGSTTWCKGITVQYSALGADKYMVSIISGKILDDRGEYNLAGVTLGIFSITPPEKKSLLSGDQDFSDYPVATFNALANTNTPTSPNTNVVTTPSGDSNNTSYLAFQYQQRITVWSPVVSQAQQSVVLGQDYTIGSTTWVTGITVQYAALGASQYMVSITTGTILDDRARYDLAGVTLGIFPINPG